MLIDGCLQCATFDGEIDSKNFPRESGVRSNHNTGTTEGTAFNSEVYLRGVIHKDGGSNRIGGFNFATFAAIGDGNIYGVIQIERVIGRGNSSAV